MFAIPDPVHPLSAEPMAKPNYQYEKRQKDLAKQRKKQEKEQEKAARKASKAPGTEVSNGDESVAPEPVEEASQESKE